MIKNEISVKDGLDALDLNGEFDALFGNLTDVVEFTDF